MTSQPPKSEVRALFYSDRRRAHSEIFKHRHPDESPEFHSAIIDRIHERSTTPALIVGFRGSAKSTLIEEAVGIRAGFREFKNGLILGATLPLACQRLHAVRREVERNPRLAAVFGDLRGTPWTEDRLEFANGITLTAMGKGQALRGSKDDTLRPDLVIADDVEDEESLKTEKGRDKIQSWLLAEVMQAMDPGGRIIILANLLHEECLAVKLQTPDSGFTCDIYPWEYLDLVTGERRAAWPSRFSLEAIDKKKRQLYALGRGREYEREYMCRVIADRERPFRPAMKKVEPRIRVWEAVYAMYDPARTKTERSATTGKAAWSWIGNRLVVWELAAHRWMPDEIIADIFRLNERWRPVRIGFEEDGLNQWALQPIRAEQVRRGVMLPLTPVKAPQGKMDFIKGLQPFFTAGEVQFAQEFGEAWQQFLGFPMGDIDAPNALAYALHRSLKPGIPIYEDFGVVHVQEEIPVDRGRTVWLALGATPVSVTAILAQFDGERLRVLADYVREGDPREVTARLLKEATLDAGKPLTLVAAPQHFSAYTNVGLVSAAARAGAQCQSGTLPDAGRVELRGLLRGVSRHLPTLLISSRARWTLNGLAGGFCRLMMKGGQLADMPEDGVYRTLIEGLESFAGLMSVIGEDGDTGRNYVTNAHGQRFISAQPQRR